jgi:hypothetical protein
MGQRPITPFKLVRLGAAAKAACTRQPPYPTDLEVSSAGWIAP